MLGISFWPWDTNKLKESLKQRGMIWPQALAASAQEQALIHRDIGIIGVPYTLLIDKDGSILGVDERGDELYALLDKALKKD